MLARKIAYNVVINAAMKVLSTILALIGIGLLTRYLGQAGFGDYATVLAFFAFFSALADLGLYSVTTREISRLQANEEKIISNVFTLRLLISFLIFLFIPILVYFLPYSSQVKHGIIIIGLAFVFSSSYMVLNGIFQKRLIMDKVAYIEFVGKIIQVSFLILAVWRKWGFELIIGSLLLLSMFDFIVITFLAKRYVNFSLNIDWDYWKKFIKMSLPMGLAVFIAFLYFKTDTILLSLLKGSKDVGIYNGAYKIIENITFFPGMIMGLILPIFSRNIFTDRFKFYKAANKTFKVFLILIVPLIIIVWFLAQDIMLIVGGKNFLSSAPVLKILVLALGFIFYGNFFNNILLAGNLQSKLMKVLAFCAIFNIGANIILIPYYSYWASAIISLVTEALVTFLTFYLVKKYLNYIPKFENVGKIILSGIIMGMFLFLSSYRNFFFLFSVSSLIYLIMLYITQAITQKEIKSLLKGI